MIEVVGAKGQSCDPDCRCGKHKKRRMSKETREKISRARREIDRRNQEFAASAPQPDQKRCTKCEAVKDIDDFYKNPHKLASGEVRYYTRSWCIVCELERTAEYRDKQRQDGTRSQKNRENYDRIMADPERAERRRQYNREWAAQKRRREGMKVVGPWKRYRESGLGKRLPLAPIQQVLVEHLGSNPNGSLNAFADRIGMDHQQLRRVFKGYEVSSHHGEVVEKKTVTEDVVDRILIGLGRQGEFHDLYPPPVPVD